MQAQVIYSDQQCGPDDRNNATKSIAINLSREMIPSFSLKPLPAIIFGPGCLDRLSTIGTPLGEKVLIITGEGFKKRYHHWSSVEAQLLGAGLRLEYAIVSGEPSPEIIDRLVASFHSEKLDWIVGIGGGSVIDTGKAVAAMLPAGETIEQFLEGVGTRQPDGSTLPFVAVPTTAGTGSEASANAVITRTGSDGYKKSLRHQNYVPDWAIIDPQLMRTCPPELTAACAMDAFTQLVEGFLSTQASVLTDAIAWSGLEAVQRSLVPVYHDGDDLEARGDMAYAALCSGIVLANAGLGVIHGLAPAVGSSLSMSHGAVCGTLMGAGNEVTLQKLTELVQPGSHYQYYIDKYQRLGHLFCKDLTITDNGADCFIQELHRLIDLLQLPRLAEFGATSDDLNSLIDSAQLKNNPAPLAKDDIRKILEQRL